MDDFDPSQPGLTQRRPPRSEQAEQALLGALLANNKAFERVSDFLMPDHFADPVHGRIYEAIARRCEQNMLADPVTLRAELEHSGVLAEVGGIAYLAQLLSAMVGIINAGDYGRLIHDAWLRRQLIDIGEVMVNDAHGGEPDLDGRGLIEKSEQALFNLATKGGSEGKGISFHDALIAAIDLAEKAFRNQGSVSGLDTGLRDLNKRTGGLHKSDLVILAGRPGMGKTALATKIAFGAAKAMLANARVENPNAMAKECVAIFSLEMSADQLATRLLAEESRVSGDKIRRGEVSTKDFDTFVRVSREIADVPLVIDDTPAITLSALRTRCRRLQRTQGLGLIIVDYLQLMRPALGTRPESRVLEISQITQGLKAIAKELAVPVVALSQLSRSVESRDDKRPQLSDLRESGSIEQDADMVMFIYRDEYYLAQREPKITTFEREDKYQEAMDKWKADMQTVYQKAELIIAKQRHGPTGKVDLFFEGEFTRFTDLETTHG